MKTEIAYCFDPYTLTRNTGDFWPGQTKQIRGLRSNRFGWTRISVYTFPHVGRNVSREVLNELNFRENNNLPSQQSVLDIFFCFKIINKRVRHQRRRDNAMIFSRNNFNSFLWRIGYLSSKLNSTSEAGERLPFY